MKHLILLILLTALIGCTPRQAPPGPDYDADTPTETSGEKLDRMEAEAYPSEIDRFD